MRDGAESFALADRTFFDWPGNWDLEATRFPAPPLPDGWTRDDNEAWTFCRPAEDHLPDQGWKIHVSAAPDDARRTLADVAAYCTRHGLAFKYLKSANVLRALSRKYAQRSSAGKLLTVYPVDDAELARTLEGLDALVGGRPGPYVLTDLRFREGPLYVRYGGFRTRYTEDGNGDLVTAFRRPDGTPEPDRRTPVFHTPDWVTVPDILKDSLAARQAVDDFPYRITGALQFSNGGGVYRATPVGADALGAGEESVVLKEGRPYSGTDGVGRDAVSRLAHEHRMLERLAGLPGIPRTFGTLQVRDHLFLVLEDIAGQDFQTWLAAHHPLTVPDPDERAVAAYRDRALALLGRIEALVAAVHGRGIRIGDLHPGNLIIKPGDEPVLLDFEVADEADRATPSSLGAPGFHRADATGTDGDHYALAAIGLWLFLPLAALGGLAPDKAPALLAAAAERYALPDALVSRLAPQLAPNDDTTCELASPQARGRPPACSPPSAAGCATAPPRTARTASSPATSSSSSRAARASDTAQPVSCGPGTPRSVSATKRARPGCAPPSTGYPSSGSASTTVCTEWPTCCGSWATNRPRCTPWTGPPTGSPYATAPASTAGCPASASTSCTSPPYSTATPCAGRPSASPTASPSG